MSALQGTQADAFLWLNYGHVALTSLWVYDYILFMPDSVTFIVESRWGIGTSLYLGCSHLPFALLAVNMLALSLLVIAIIYLGFTALLAAECIFILRSFAIWERQRRFMVFKIINAVVYLVQIIVCFHEFTSSFSEESSAPGVLRYADTKASSSVIAVYSVLAVAELEILLFVLYRAVENHGG
ncbi:uncharacterized protein EDB91DRAFT_1084354 [Suillus paluster]|uniref:uncharacterized protein n=1 Tax=Suillus paluster TaxID=48578 RepID=UPI001B8836D7|nr:uncharacterized protein EDB91DRAFT_1084354 [Suillus paluster]KAG1733627.1 hypothetical protein EDB91DRAFT_1084354 [Suillus paluster]